MSGDVYRFINEYDQQTIARIAERLEFRGTDPGYVSFREEYFTKLPLHKAQKILALGCGTGVEVRALLHRPEFKGRILGIDHSPQLLAEAQNRSYAEGSTDRVEYLVGDAHALDLPDSNFDIILAHTLLSHVTDPPKVLNEARRLITSDGTIAIFDGDYASLTFAYPDPELAEQVEKRLLEVIINNPRIMRDLPRLLRDAELEVVEATVHAYADIGYGSFFANIPDAYGAMLASSGLMPTDDIARWRDWQTQALADGVFFGACNYYTYVARRKMIP